MTYLEKYYLSELESSRYQRFLSLGINQIMGPDITQKDLMHDSFPGLERIAFDW